MVLSRFFLNPLIFEENCPETQRLGVFGFLGWGRHPNHRTMHVMYAPVPAAQEAAAGQTVRPAVTAGGLALVFAKHARSEQS